MMVPYVVRTGDHLLLIAHRRGFDADTVWNDPKNADLKKLRGKPNVLCCGDILYVPENPTEWRSLAVGAVNTFVATEPTTTLSLTFAQEGNALAGAKCIVHGLPPPNEFTTDGTGKLSLTVPVTVQELVVEFPKVPLVRRVRIGHLDPITEPTGVLQRLGALGYISARTRVDSSDAAAVARVIAAFQKDKGLPVTGTLDEGTKSALQQAHGV